MAARLAQHLRIFVIDRREYLDSVALRLFEFRSKIYFAAFAGDLSFVRLPRSGDAAKALRKLINADGPDLVRQVERYVGLTLGELRQNLPPCQTRSRYDILHTCSSGPIVYRLGHELFMLGRGVRLSLGLPLFTLCSA